MSSAHYIPTAGASNGNSSSIVTELDNGAFEKFGQVDDYITNHLVPQDDALLSTLKNNEDEDLDAIDVSPNDGKFLYLLCKMNKVKRVLEVGTLGGYSAIWMAKAIPEDGKIITCEYEPSHASVAATNIKNAGFEKKIDIKVGAAQETLEKMSAAGPVEPFDLVFIDADKRNNWVYYSWVLKHACHVGTVLVVDNVVRRGRIVDGDNQETDVVGTRHMFEMLKKEKRVECTALQTVGAKGWDGMVVSIVVE